MTPIGSGARNDGKREGEGERERRKREEEGGRRKGRRWGQRESRGGEPNREGDVAA